MIRNLRMPHPLTIALAAGGAAADDARTTLLKELRAAGGRLAALATRLGVSSITALRLVQRAGLGDVAAEIRCESGVPGPRTNQSQRKEAARDARARAAK